MSQFSVTILGCSSAVPAHGRFPTSQVVKHQSASFLIDCGEGTQFQFNTYKIKRSGLNHIFISHLHGDHYFGLVGLLNSFNLQGRKVPLHLYGPPELEPIVLAQANYKDEFWNFPIHFYPHEYGSSYKIAETNHLEVFTIPLEHRIPCNGFLFREKPKARKINAEALAKYHVPNEVIPKLRFGEDYTPENGNRIPNNLLTYEAPKSKSYAYCSDTQYNESIIPIIKNVDLLYHEATYLHENEDKAIKWHHSTTKQAATIAKKANVARLIIGHYSAKYRNLNPFQEEARHIFEHSDLALEGKVFEL